MSFNIICYFTFTSKRADVHTSIPDTSLAFNLVTPTEVKLEISRIQNNKSHSLYSRPTQLLKSTSNVNSKYPCRNLNSIYFNGVHPSKLKMTKIIPIFKTDDNTQASNYRPISLLSNFNRIFEKLIFKSIEPFIEQNNLLSSSQYDFRKALSAQHAILDISTRPNTNNSN